MFPPFETEKEEIALPPEAWMGVAALIISECLHSLFAQSLKTKYVYSRIDLWSGPIQSMESDSLHSISLSVPLSSHWQYISWYNPIYVPGFSCDD